jgi:hypothetical protein
VAVEPAAEPAPAPAIEEAPRAITPRLEPACFHIYSPEEDSPAHKSCEWDDGFPAVSRDGKLVVTKYVEDDGGRGNPNLRIRFLDVATSKVVRDVLVLDADEVDAMYDDEGQATKRAQLERKVAQRMATAQRLIDARGYRSLEHLGTNDAHNQFISNDRSKIHAEFDATAVRAIDPATNRVLWQRRFDVPNPTPDNGHDECMGWGLRELDIAWDPETRVVIATSQYDRGGCMCSTDVVQQVVRVP